MAIPAARGRIRQPVGAILPVWRVSARHSGDLAVTEMGAARACAGRAGWGGGGAAGRPIPRVHLPARPAAAAAAAAAATIGMLLTAPNRRYRRVRGGAPAAPAQRVRRRRRRQQRPPAPLGAVTVAANHAAYPHAASPRAARRRDLPGERRGPGCRRTHDPGPGGALTSESGSVEGRRWSGPGPGLRSSDSLGACAVYPTRRGWWRGWWLDSNFLIRHWRAKLAGAVVRVGQTGRISAPARGCLPGLSLGGPGSSSVSVRAAAADPGRRDDDAVIFRVVMESGQGGRG